MQESLLTLFQLQQIDRHLHELERLKVDIPNKIEALDKKQMETETHLSEQAQRLEALQRDRRQRERDLQAVQDQLKKYQMQLHSVKTNKEYDALQHEIIAQKTRVGEHEEAILRLMEAIESATKTLEEIHAVTEQEKERIASERIALKEKLLAVDDDVAVKLDERKRTLMRIEDRVVKAYDRIRRGRTHSAVVPVKKGACGGCYHVIPLQVIAEIRKMNRLITCESCGRILVIEHEEEHP
jgi:predicted  nucleic acid-binding Zn-ribbon protein